jgi:hypothetical protein
MYLLRRDILKDELKKSSYEFIKLIFLFILEKYKFYFLTNCW